MPLEFIMFKEVIKGYPKYVISWQLLCDQNVEEEKEKDFLSMRHVHIITYTGNCN